MTEIRAIKGRRLEILLGNTRPVTGGTVRIERLVERRGENPAAWNHFLAVIQVPAGREPRELLYEYRTEGEADINYDSAVETGKLITKGI